MNKLVNIISSAVLGASVIIPMSCTSLPAIKAKPQINIVKVLSQKEREYVQMVKAVDKTLVKHDDPDKIDLQVLVDKNYLDVCESKNKDWWEKIKYNVIEHSAKKFRDVFGMDIDIDGVKYISLDDVNDAGYLFSQIKLENDLENFDAILSFVSRPIEGILGLAEFKGNYALVMSHGNEHKTAQHELSHLVGAIDIYLCDPNWWNNAKEKVPHPMWWHKTIMTYHSPKSDEWNTANILRINNTKHRSWKPFTKNTDELKKYISSFDKKFQEDVFKVVCHTDNWSYSEEGAQLAEYLCLQFPKDWKLKYFYSQILKTKPGKRKIVEIAELYKQIIRLNPKEAFIYNNIAWTMYANYGYLKYLGLDALELAKKAVEMKETSYNLDTLGYIYYHTGKYEKAAVYLEKAVEKTNNLEVATHLARLYHKTGSLKKFKKAVKRMFEIEPEEAMIHHNYATALMTKFGDYLEQDDKLEVLDVALQGYDIYPCAMFAVLVMDAYEFNAGNQDEEFKRKYEDRVMNILFGGNKK